MSDSDFSGEENAQQLREAVNNEFISDSLFSKNVDDISAEKCEKRPSIRAELQKEHDCHPLNVTPEFQRFVAKHLSRILDRELEEMWQESSECQHAQQEASCHEEGGVRLFASSTCFVTMEQGDSSKKRQKNRQRIVVEHDSEEELEKCQSTSVSPDWVLSKKGIEGWEKSSKGEIVMVNKKGEIVGHKNAKTKIRTNSHGVRQREFHIAI